MGSEVYTEMIKMTFDNMKCIIDKEDLTKSGFAKTAKRTQKSLREKLEKENSSKNLDIKG